MTIYLLYYVYIYTGLYSLSQPQEDSEEKEAEILILNDIKARVETENGLNFVMKPQREGGGNNFYGVAVAEALRTMSLDEQSAYILMERILPPSSDAELVRDGKMYTVCMYCNTSMMMI